MVFAGLLDRVRKWWRSAPVAPTPVPFEVVCPCGEAARGTRKAESQVLCCARCGEPVFVLPFSQLPPVIAEESSASRSWVFAGPSWLRRLGPWGLPLVAAVLTLLVLVGVYVFIVGPLFWGSREAMRLNGG